MEAFWLTKWVSTFIKEGGGLKKKHQPLRISFPRVFSQLTHVQIKDTCKKTIRR